MHQTAFVFISLFYSTKFLNHDMMADLLDEEDQNAFKHLKELNVEDSEDVKSGFKISFVRIHSAHASSSPSYLLLGVRQQPLLQEQGTHQNFPIQ